MGKLRSLILHAWIVPIYGYLHLAAVQSRCVQSETLCSFPFSKWLSILAMLFVATYVVPRIFLWWHDRSGKRGSPAGAPPAPGL